MQNTLDIHRGCVKTFLSLGLEQWFSNLATYWSQLGGFKKITQMHESQADILT